MSVSAAFRSRFPRGPDSSPVDQSVWPKFEPNDDRRRDFFAGQGKHSYAGEHLILDLWGGTGLDDLQLMESALREATEASGATLLHIHLHHFTPNDGISAVAVLAESHISVHTWPERDYAAFDFFMCGKAKPGQAVKVIEQRFGPVRTELHRLFRGQDTPALA